MNAAHLHLIVSHIPIFTTLIGIFVLMWGMNKKEISIRNIAFVLFIFGALSSYAALETGESAEEIVEEVAAVSHDAIHDHEEAAELSLWSAVVMGLFSIGALVAQKYKFRFETGLNVAILLFALITLGLLAYTAYEGGEIRHPEAYTEQIDNPNVESSNQIA